MTTFPPNRTLARLGLGLGLCLGLLWATPATPVAAEEAAAPAPAAQPAAQPDPAAAAAHPELDARSRLELQVLAGVNGQRAAHGLAPLRLDDRLVAAARQHAVDMAYRHHCSHWGRDGSSVRMRIRRNGYAHDNWAGENILCGRRTADSALGWWMSSWMHRANILNANYTHIGVGISMHGSSGPDMALVFASGEAATVEPGVYEALRTNGVAAWVAATKEPENPWAN